MSSEAPPYVGPRPFETEDIQRFFGRDREALELLSLIIAHPAVLLYAQSGAGKTSLLNARLIPMLGEPGDEPVSMPRYAELEVFPIARLRATVPEGVNPNDVNNPFTFAALLSWGAATGEDPAALTRLTLRDYLAARPHQTDDIGDPKPRVLIFDQFEELFTTHMEHWEKRAPFIQQIADALAADPFLRVLLSIREDYVGQLDPFAPLLPEQLQTRFRLERLRADAALLAVEGPLTATDRCYEEGVAKILVQELLRSRVESAEGQVVEVTGQYVEPVQLQVVCSSIWANLPPETKAITEEHLRKFGDVDKALNDFYDRVVDEAIKKARVGEDRLRRWVEDVLITGLGTRNTVYRGPRDTGGMDNAVIDVLEDRHLIRAERRAGARWYELTHDRLIEPIRASNREWFEARAQTRARAFLTALVIVGVFFIVGASVALVLRSVAQGEFAATSTAQAAAAATAQAGAALAQAQVSAEQSLFLASSAQQVLSENNTDLALALALEAVARAPTPAPAEVQRTLANIAYGPGTRLRVEYGAPVSSVALSPEGRTALSGLGDGSIILWDVATGAEVRRLVGHTNTVESVAFSPDGTRALSGSRDKLVILWDIATGAEIRRFEGGSRVTSVAFSPDGLTALSGSADRLMRLWDVATGAEIRRFGSESKDIKEGHGAQVQSVAFSPDGSYAVSGSVDNTLILWDVATGAMIRRLEGHTDWVNSVAFSADGRTVLSGSGDGTVRLWDIGSGEARRLTGHADRVLCVAFSPDGFTALSGSADSVIILWDVRNGAEVRRFYGHSGLVRSVAFSPDGKQALSGAEDRSARLWDLTDRAEIRRFDAHGYPVLTMALSPDGKYALSSGADYSLTLWEVETGEEIYYRSEMMVAGPVSQIMSLAISPDGKTYLAGQDDGSVILGDVETGGERLRLMGHSDAVRSVAFSPDGQYVLSGAADGSVILWDLATGAEVRRFGEQGAPVSSVAFNPDRMVALSGHDDGSLILWNTETGEQLRRFDRPTDAPEMLIVTHEIGVNVRMGPGLEYPIVAQASSGDLMVMLEDPNTARSRLGVEGQWVMVGLPDGHQGWSAAWYLSLARAVNSVAISPDGQAALSGSADGLVILWDINTGAEVRRFEGHARSVESVAFSPDGQHILSGSADGTVRLWDVNTGMELRRYAGHTSAVISVAISADGRTALSGSADGTLRLWRIDSLDEMSEWIRANRHVRPLTCDERARFRVEPLCNAEGVVPTRTPTPEYKGA